MERAGHEERIDHRSHAERGLDEQPTIYEGVVARALEKKGIVSDRCELNVLKPDLECYALLVQQIENKTKERKILLAKKKAAPFYQFVAHNDVANQIAELTEDLEELKSEKTMLLSTLDCNEESGIAEVKKNVAAMKKNLERLTKQEEKYAAELENALTQFSELREQAKDVDSVELSEQRAALQPDKIQAATSKIKAAYGEKFDPLFLNIMLYKNLVPKTAMVAVLRVCASAQNGNVSDVCYFSLFVSDRLFFRNCAYPSFPASFRCIPSS